MNAYRYSASVSRKVAGALAWLALTAMASGGTADLAILVDDGPDPVVVNADLTYAIAVTNAGPDSANNVIMTDPLPLGVDFVSCDVSQGTWSNDSGVIRCSLGAILNGATAGVTVVVTPTSVGQITNQPSIYSDDADLIPGDNRASAITTVEESNRGPVITLPAPYVVPVGSTSAFTVVVTDENHDPVGLTNPAGPPEATFANSNFAWVVDSSYENSTNVLMFVADDGQGQTNSIVTNSTYVTVPYDYDADGLGDGWEWDQFASLTNLASGDHDGDGTDNYTEYVAGTQPTNPASAIRVAVNAAVSDEVNHYVEVDTEPGRLYTIEYADGPLTNGMVWLSFADASDGVGTWQETNEVSATFTFHDDESIFSTGGEPVSGLRVYRVKVEVP